MRGKEGTADFADFVDEGDAAQGSRWRAKSLVRDSTMLGRHSPLLFPTRVIHVIRGQIHPQSTIRSGDVPSP